MGNFFSSNNNLPYPQTRMDQPSNNKGNNNLPYPQTRMDQQSNLPYPQTRLDQQKPAVQQTPAQQPDLPYPQTRMDDQQNKSSHSGGSNMVLSLANQTGGADPSDFFNLPQAGQETEPSYFNLPEYSTNDSSYFDTKTPMIQDSISPPYVFESNPSSIYQTSQPLSDDDTLASDYSIRSFVEEGTAPLSATTQQTAEPTLFNQVTYQDLIVMPRDKLERACLTDNYTKRTVCSGRGSNKFWRDRTIHHFPQDRWTRFNHNDDWLVINFLRNAYEQMHENEPTEQWNFETMNQIREHVRRNNGVLNLSNSGITEMVDPNLFKYAIPGLKKIVTVEEGVVIDDNNNLGF